VAVVALGAIGFGLLLDAPPDAATLVFVAVYLGALVVLLATDLDQRLLPDVITLPLIAYVLAGVLLGIDPLVRVGGELAWAALAAIVVPALLWLASLPFGAGAIGLGDLKLLVSVGLLVGAARLVAGLLAGALLAGVVIMVLLAARRITLRTYVPYGPFLIIGAGWILLSSLR
jgi:leader peptidase (prepilin peptidase)/N-methyltransferase